MVSLKNSHPQKECLPDVSRVSPTLAVTCLSFRRRQRLGRQCPQPSSFTHAPRTTGLCPEPLLWEGALASQKPACDLLSRLPTTPCRNRGDLAASQGWGGPLSRHGPIRAAPFPRSSGDSRDLSLPGASGASQGENPSPRLALGSGCQRRKRTESGTALGAAGKENGSSPRASALRRARSPSTLKPRGQVPAAGFAVTPLPAPGPGTHGSCLSWNRSSSMSALRQDQPFSWPLHGRGDGERAGCRRREASSLSSGGSCSGEGAAGDRPTRQSHRRGRHRHRETAAGWAERRGRRAGPAARAGAGSAGRRSLRRGGVGPLRSRPLTRAHRLSTPLFAGMH